MSDIQVAWVAFGKKNPTCVVQIAMKRSDTCRIKANKSELGHSRLLRIVAMVFIYVNAGSVSEVTLTVDSEADGFPGARVQV